MFPHDLNGKVIAVTGGFGILGSAVARVAISRGARVALIGHAPRHNADHLGAEADRILTFPGVDLTVCADVEAIMNNIVTKFGGLNALVNTAGAFRFGTLADSPIDAWDQLFDTNLKTAVVASKAALPHLLAAGGGRIVNIGANSAIKAGAGMGPYAASKSAVARLTESLAEEMKGHSITVNAVLPSIIDTPQNRADMPDADFSRWVPPTSIAEVIAFLLSDAAADVTGALIPITGRT